jgi:hypothetical protein
MDPGPDLEHIVKKYVHCTYHTVGNKPETYHNTQPPFVKGILAKINKTNKTFLNGDLPPY